MNTFTDDILFAHMFQHSDKPSECTATPWLYAENKQNFSSTDFSGKWCVFVSPEEVNRVWNKVKKACSSSKLTFAKVSTNYSFGSHKKHVICVYTKDYRDSADLMAARDALRKIGILEELGYKRDIDTRNNVYGENEWLLKSE